LARKGVILIDHPDWIDLDLSQAVGATFRFDHLMAYMYWMVSLCVDKAKAKNYVVVHLDKVCTRELVEQAIKEYDPICHLHGSHGACNALAGAKNMQEATTPINSPVEPCSTSDPLIPDGTHPCDFDNSYIDSGRICVDIACISNRTLGVHRIKHGALAVIAYNDLLPVIVGTNPNTYFLEEYMREAYTSPFLALLEGKTTGEAMEYAVQTYNKVISEVENKDSFSASRFMFARDQLLLRGSSTATIGQPSVVIPPVQVTPSLKYALLTGAIVAGSFGLGYLIVEGGK